jgi:hypothetical protein
LEIGKTKHDLFIYTCIFLLDRLFLELGKSAMKKLLLRSRKEAYNNTNVTIYS